MVRNQNGKRPKYGMPTGHELKSPPKTRTSPRNLNRANNAQSSGGYTIRVVGNTVDKTNTNIVGHKLDGQTSPNQSQASSSPGATSQSGGYPLHDFPAEELATETTTTCEKKFRLMDLPAELRLNIYRCCLTRPYNILLHKEPAHRVAKVETQEPSDDDRGDEADSDFEGVMAAGTARITGCAATKKDIRQARAAAARDLRRLGAERGVPESSRRVTRASTAASRIVIGRDPNESPFQSTPQPRLPKPQDKDPLVPAVLCLSKQVYKEARSVLYSDNKFDLELQSALPSLARLHQRSRGQIRHIELTILNHGDILEKFAEVIRLGLRYCWGLHRLVIHMPFSLPTDGSGHSGSTTVYANAFDILRWLPRQAEVVLEGNVCEEIRTVAGKCANLAKTLDEVQYARRQLISNETERVNLMG